jgi:hypothetical protein
MYTMPKRRDLMLWTSLSVFMLWSLFGCIVVDDGQEFESIDEEEFEDGFEHEFDEHDPDLGTDEPANNSPEPDEPETRPDPEPGVPAFSIQGSVVSVDELEIPERAKVVVIWQVSTTSPDSLVKFGQGTSDGSTFRVDFPEDAPIPEALNEDALGVGFVLMVPEDIQLPEDGVLDREAFRMLEGSSLGISTRHAVVYHAPYEGSYRFDWAADFDQGAYNCGEGVDGGDDFDAIRPVDCAEVEVQMTPMIMWIDWT